MMRWASAALAVTSIALLGAMFVADAAYGGCREATSICPDKKKGK